MFHVLRSTPEEKLHFPDSMMPPSTLRPRPWMNAIPEAINEIRSGGMLATADFNAMQMASLATECAMRHLRGEPVPKDLELPVQIVDRANYAAWDLSYEKRPVVTLKELNA